MYKEAIIMHIASYNRPSPGDDLLVLNSKLKAIGENQENEIINIEDYKSIKQMFEKCYSKYNFTMIENINGYSTESKLYHSIEELEDDDVVVINSFNNEIIRKGVA